MPSRNLKVLRNAGLQYFSPCGTVLHFAPLAPAHEMTVVLPNHSDNQKKPPKLSHIPSTGSTAFVENH